MCKQRLSLTGTQHINHSRMKITTVLELCINTMIANRMAPKDSCLINVPIIWSLVVLIYLVFSHSMDTLCLAAPLIAVPVQKE